jgi:hypothetical protein
LDLPYLTGVLALLVDAFEVGEDAFEVGEGDTVTFRVGDGVAFGDVVALLRFEFILLV